MRQEAVVVPECVVGEAESVVGGGKAVVVVTESVVGEAEQWL